MPSDRVDDETLIQNDPFWGKPRLAYHVQGRFPESALASLRRMQDCLTREVSAPVNPIPESALHLSVYSPIPLFWPDEAKEPFWQSRRERMLELMPELIAACSGLALDFESTRIFPTAVVAIIRDRTDTIRSIRERLAEVFRHPTLLGQSYDLIHCTLGRFAADATLSADEVRAYQAHWRPFSTPLRALALVRERRYPSLEVDDLAETIL